MSEIQETINLSICIPTYNFGNYIGETLACIVEQWEPGVEVLVLDGGSTDNTPGVVSQYQIKCPALFYYRQDFKGGIDQDMARVVSLARGKYCWLMSGDDLIKPGAIKSVLAEIKSNNDIYLCNRTECDIKMQPFRNRYFLKESVQDSIFNLHDKHDLRRYLGLAASLGALFSYMSSIIFKKSSWDQAPDKEYAFGSCYGHVYTLFSLADQACFLKYIRQPLVFCRIGNDSFSSNGFIRRIAIDFDGYRKIAERLFIDDPVMQKIFKGVLKKEYSLFRLVKIRAFSDTAEWREITPKLKDIGYRPLTIWFCGLIKFYKPAINGLIHLKQSAGKIKFCLSLNPLIDESQKKNI